MVKPLGTSEFAQAVGLSIPTVRRREKQGLIRAVRDFRGWRQFSPTEVERVRRLLGWEVLGDARPGDHEEIRGESGAPPARQRRRA
jgi:MerR HTH family regulatory protein